MNSLSMSFVDPTLAHKAGVLEVGSAILSIVTFPLYEWISKRNYTHEGVNDGEEKEDHEEISEV